jgi:branched-chain amino acid transport system substrate-binding protein
MQVWVRYINERGGVNGHPVNVIVYDDGFDPARHRAAVQDAIENRRVLAFLANPDGPVGESSAPYIESKRIPVIGTETGGSWFYRYSMYFLQGSSGQHFFRASVAGAADQLVKEGQLRLGTLVCAEVAECDAATGVVADYAPRVGFQVVYQGKASLAQPDFTAECLAARNAGVQVIWILMDSNSVQRFAAACARQGYRPGYVTFSVIIADRMKDDPNLEGMVGVSTVFPYFQTDTPATDEFHAAMGRFGKTLAPGIGPATGWVAGKMFEKAAANMPEPPTTEAILRGLWSIKSDTLGGLTSQPLTFEEGQPTQPMVCWYTARIRDGAWTSPDGFKAHCR